MMSRRSCIQTIYLISNSLKHPILKTTFQPVLPSRIGAASMNLCPSISSRFYSKKIEPKEQRLVYYGQQEPHIKACKLFSFTSSLIGIIAQPFLYESVAKYNSVGIIVACYSFVGFFTVVTPFLLHLITKKYVTHLEYNEAKDTYIATTVNFFCIPKKTEFKVDDVKVPDVPGMFTSFIAKGMPLFLDPNTFDQPSHYARIMGYDKPVDFGIYDDTPENNNKK